MSLTGKVSRYSGLKYTPSGIATLQFTLAVPQSILDTPSVGYFKVEAFGDSAVELSEVTRVGSEFLVEGSLWNRSYTNRQGFKVFEVKVVAGRVQQPGSENWFVFEKRSPGEAETHKASC